MASEPALSTLDELAPRKPVPLLGVEPRTMRRLGSAALALVLLAAAAYVAVGRAADPLALLDLPVGLVLGAFALRCVAYLCSTAAVHAVVSADVPGLSFLEYLRVASRGTALTYVASSAGGIGYKSAYFRYRHGIPVPRFVGITAATSLLGITAGSLVGLVGLAAITLRGVAVAPLCWAAAGGGLVVGTLPVALLATRWPTRVPGLRGLTRALSHVPLALAPLARAFGLSIVQSIASGSALGILFVAYRPGAVAFVSGVVADSLTAAARVVMITPRNVGINEWLVGIVGRAAGMALETALTASMLYLTVALASTLTIFAVSNFLPLGKASR